MYHYTYIITNITDSITTGKYYIGVRSCDCDPIEDIYYLGSSKYLSEDIDRLGKDKFKKNIICVFDNRQDAMLHEIELHHKFDVGNNQLFYNKINSSSEGFTWIGQAHTDATKQKIRQKRKNQKITEAQIEKFKRTWANKSKNEVENYKKYRQDLWKNKSKHEKELFKEKMSQIVSDYWKTVSDADKQKRVKKILTTKANWSPEQKERDFLARSKAQKKAKNNRSQEQINLFVEKRKNTYKNMSEDRLNQISKKRSKKMKGRKWYNNGQISKMFFENEVPDGFKLGRKF